MRLWIKEMRVAKKMTQNELAEASGVSRTMITEIESGRSLPSIKTAQSIANVLGFNWTRFFEPEKEAS